jgi:hypothetical protein
MSSDQDAERQEKADYQRFLGAKHIGCELPRRREDAQPALRQAELILLLAPLLPSATGAPNPVAQQSSKLSEPLETI